MAEQQRYRVPMDRSFALVSESMLLRLIESARKRGDEQRAQQLEEIYTAPAAIRPPA